MEKKNKRKVLILVIVVILVAVVVIFNLSKDKEKPIAVQTEKVKKDKLVQTVNASGSLSPVTQVKISANVSARITNITVKEGNAVRRGDLLVELDRAQYEAAFEQYSSMVQSSMARLRKVDNDLKRMRDLYKSNLASDADLEAATADKEIAESQVVQSEAILKKAQDDLDKTRINAPMGGIVTSVAKEVGEIALGSVFQEDVILIISDMSKMEVKVEVDETDVVALHVGDTTKIEIDAIPDTVFNGMVSEIAHSATTRGYGTQEQVTNFEVKISVLGQDARFRPGMSSTVDIVTNVRNNVVVVPIQALTVRAPVKEENEEEAGSEPAKLAPEKEEMEDVVFVVTLATEEENPKKGLLKKKNHPRAEQRAVKIGISSDTHFEVLTGLEEGEEIVTGSYKVISKELKHNSPLKIGGEEKGEKGDKK